MSLSIYYKHIQVIIYLPVVCEVHLVGPVKVTLSCTIPNIWPTNTSDGVSWVPRIHQISLVAQHENGTILPVRVNSWVTWSNNWTAAIPRHTSVVVNCVDCEWYCSTDLWANHIKTEALCCSFSKYTINHELYELIFAGTRSKKFYAIYKYKNLWGDNVIL